MLWKALSSLDALIVAMGVILTIFFFSFSTSHLWNSSLIEAFLLQMENCLAFIYKDEQITRVFAAGLGCSWTAGMILEDDIMSCHSDQDIQENIKRYKYQSPKYHSNFTVTIILQNLNGVAFVRMIKLDWKANSNHISSTVMVGSMGQALHPAVEQ